MACQPGTVASASGPSYAEDCLNTEVRSQPRKHKETQLLKNKKVECPKQKKKKKKSPFPFLSMV
jgi:hypothetical protein